MGWLSKLMFWRNDEPAVTNEIVEAVEGYTVDGCFTAPDQDEAPVEDRASEPIPDVAPRASD